MKSAIQKLFFSVLLLAPGAAFAAGASQGSAAFNALEWGLMSIITVLAAAIIMLAFVYQQLAYAYRDKLRKERSGTASKTALLLLLAGLASFKALAQEAAAEVAARVPVSPFINGMMRTDFYFLIGVIAFELVVVGMFVGIIWRMVRILRGVPDAAPATQPLFLKKILYRLTNTVAVKDEERIVLQHEYDGIRELDNSLPPWWKYGFILTIIFSVGYMWYYHVHDGPNQIDEYTAAVQKAEKEKAAYMARAGNALDETNVSLIVDKAELADAATLFKNTCAACHREDAGGMVGPNLTDNYWLHGGSLPDVFRSIKYGWKDKGMPEWQHNMSAKQMAGLASYIRHLSGKNVPGGKEPQGDLYVEAGNGAAADTAVKSDSPKLSMKASGQKERG